MTVVCTGNDWFVVVMCFVLVMTLVCAGNDWFVLVMTVVCAGNDCGLCW